MIQVYLPGNTNYNTNGDMVIFPESATITAELNGAWTAFIIHPLDDEGRWEALIDNAVVKMPSWNGEQLFRIRVKDKSDLEGVTCELDPIFYDAARDCFLEDVRPTNKNGQQAIDILTAANTKYHGESNISVVATAYYEFKNLLEAISGEEENSFLNRWGGEIEYDNYTIRINTRLGSDKGFCFRYGRNIEGITETVDMSEVVTRIYPKAYNGRTRSGTKYIDSPLINAYPTIRSAVVEFDNIILKADLMDGTEVEPGATICETQAELDAALGSACQLQFDAGLDKPVVTVLIEGVVPELEEFNAAKIKLGDTVHLIHPVLDINSEARIVALTYDAIADEVIGVTIGQTAYNYFDGVSSAVNRIQTAVRPDGSVRAETVKGVVDMKQANLYAQYDQAEAQDVIGILFENNDSTSQLYGAMAIGTQGFMISDTKDEAGNWIWSTFGTAKGFNASLLVVGEILADLIKGGTLTLGGANNGNGVLQVLDADGNVIGTWNNTGASITGNLMNRYGDEWIRIYQSVISGGSTAGTVDGTLDLSANVDNAVWTVLRAITGGLQLNSDNNYVSINAGSNIQETASVNAFRTATNGEIIDTAKTNSRRTATNGQIIDKAGTDAFRTATNGQIVDTAGTSAFRTAGNNIVDTATTSIAEKAGTYILEEAVDYKRVSTGANKDCYAIVGNDTNGRRIDLHADSDCYIRVDNDDKTIKTYASDFTYQACSLSIMLRSSSFNSLPVTITDSHIKSYHYVARCELSNPTAQTSDWTITTSNGSLTIAGSINGSTMVNILLVKPIIDNVVTPS